MCVYKSWCRGCGKSISCKTNKGACKWYMTGHDRLRNRANGRTSESSNPYIRLDGRHQHRSHVSPSTSLLNTVLQKTMIENL